MKSYFDRLRILLFVSRSHLPHPLHSDCSIRFQLCRTQEVIPLAVVEDLTGTIMVAILATTPVAIPTGMTTYGLDIVVKLDAAA